jgi:hypothetical protein
MNDCFKKFEDLRKADAKYVTVIMKSSTKGNAASMS